MKSGVVVLLVAVVLGFAFLSLNRRLPKEQITAALSGKVVLICGASSGIGEQLALDLAAVGAKVIIVARRLEKLEGVKKRILEEVNAKAEVGVIKCDFSDVTQSENLMSEAIKIFGRVDHLIINHAVMKLSPFLSAVPDQSPQVIKDTFQINFFSFIQIALSAIDHLEENSGNIIVTSSTAGETPFIINSIYSASKHAMNGFFYTLDQELQLRKSKVRVTVGALGLIRTELIVRAIEEYGMLTHVPAFAQGDLKECSENMIEGLVTRPGTITYPYVSTVMMRILWQIAPSVLVDSQTYADALSMMDKN